MQQNTLDKIVDYKKQELAASMRKVSLKDAWFKAQDAQPPRPFLGNFFKDQINIIAEVKKASPSAGVIRQNFNPVDIAMQYEEGGAKALSVLTDEHFFQGSLSYIEQVKAKVSLPCLRKDFTIHEYHINEARGAGADAVLLIAAILDRHQLKDYLALIADYRMAALVEIHDEAEWDKIKDLNCTLVGVNNRNLQTFQVDLETSVKLAPKMGSEITKISESGVKAHADITKLQKAGFNGFLVGESLMRQENLVEALKQLIQP